MFKVYVRFAEGIKRLHDKAGSTSVTVKNAMILWCTQRERVRYNPTEVYLSAMHDIF